MEARICRENSAVPVRDARSPSLQNGRPVFNQSGSGRQWSQKSLMDRGTLSRGMSRRNSQEIMVTDGSVEEHPWWYPTKVAILMVMAAGVLCISSMHYHWPMIKKMALLQSDMPSNPLMLKGGFTCNDLLLIEQEIAKWSETIWQFRTRIINEVPIVDMDDEEEVSLGALDSCSQQNTECCLLVNQHHTGITRWIDVDGSSSWSS